MVFVLVAMVTRHVGGEEEMSMLLLPALAVVEGELLAEVKVVNCMGRTSATAGAAFVVMVTDPSFNLFFNLNVTSGISAQSEI